MYVNYLLIYINFLSAINSYSAVNISTYLHLFIYAAIILLPPKHLK